MAVVTEVSHQDVTMYLLALKSFLRRLGPAGVVVLDDGSLTEEDRSVLQKHVRGLELHLLKDIDTTGFPRGGMWERLLLILRLSEQRYLIQMDSDTLTTGPVEEVLSAYRDNRAFLLGTRSGREIAPVATCAEYARKANGEHIQLLSERLLDGLDFEQGLRYVRASAGFAGFPKGGCRPDLLRAFSQSMESKLGPRWSEWGSEQVSSNFVLANSSNAQVLPYPKYACFDPTVPLNDSVFLHFIGTHRFERGIYARLGQKAISEMM